MWAIWTSSRHRPESSMLLQASCNWSTSWMTWTCQPWISTTPSPLVAKLFPLLKGCSWGWLPTRSGYTAYRKVNQWCKLSVNHLYFLLFTKSLGLTTIKNRYQCPKKFLHELRSAIELMKQKQDYGHWYDRQKILIKDIGNTQQLGEWSSGVNEFCEFCSFRTEKLFFYSGWYQSSVHDVHAGVMIPSYCCCQDLLRYLCCMNPTAGSFIVNQRLQRHFWCCAVPFPEQSLGWREGGSCQNRQVLVLVVKKAGWIKSRSTCSVHWTFWNT